MGMACVPPPSKYKRTYWITEHAVDQLRRRFEKEGTDHRDDKDLGHLIDQGVSIAIEAGDHEDIKDEGTDAKIVEMKGLGLWAMVKDNANSRKRSSYPKAVVTLLEDWQVSRSKKSGKWEPERYDDGEVNIGGLDEYAKKKLKELIPVSPHRQDDPVKENGMPRNGLSWWVHYSTKDGPSVPEEYPGKDAALKRMMDLFREGKALPGTLKLSQEVVPEFTA